MELNLDALVMSMVLKFPIKIIELGSLLCVLVAYCLLVLSSVVVMMNVTADVLVCLLATTP